MRLADLQDGQTVRVRTGRAGRTDVDWGPWRDAQLHVQRTSADAPRNKRQRMVCPPGGIATLTLKDGSWADYSERDFDPHYKLFLVEDYYMEIEGLEAL